MIFNPRNSKIDWDHLSRDRRDRLEMFGNLWGESQRPVPMTDEEKRALAVALNPFVKVDRALDGKFRDHLCGSLIVIGSSTGGHPAAVSSVPQEAA